MRSVSKNDLIQLWTELGIRAGDLVMCHAFLPALGKLEPHPNIFIESILERLGPEGTFVAPTFTYSFRRNEIFDPVESKSQVGILGELTRLHPGAVRSNDPLFSMAAIGTRAAELMTRRSQQCFGPGSIYASLMENHCKFLLAGVDFTGLSLFMHLEKMNSVPYRREQSIAGTSRINGVLQADAAIHFVRIEELRLDSHRKPVGDEIDRHPDCRKATLGYGTHRCTPGQVIADTVRECLARDPLFLVKSIS